MVFELPLLPYSIDALEPYISKETVEYHYKKHHATYVNNLNKLVKNSEFMNSSLEDIICSSSGAVFNNAAQTWNHSFYWKCLSSDINLQPSGKLLQDIESRFGSYEKFKENMIQAAMSVFGSGWTWLVKTADGSLEIVNTFNAQTPITQKLQPLLTIDVWEHAYYIDYRNVRLDYIENVWKLINWSFVEDNYNL